MLASFWKTVLFLWTREMCLNEAITKRPEGRVWGGHWEPDKLCIPVTAEHWEPSCLHPTSQARCRGLSSGEWHCGAWPLSQLMTHCFLFSMLWVKWEIRKSNSPKLVPTLTFFGRFSYSYLFLVFTIGSSSTGEPCKYSRTWIYLPTLYYSRSKTDVGFPSVCCEYVLLSLVNKEATMAGQNRAKQEN